MNDEYTDSRREGTAQNIADLTSLQHQSFDVSALVAHPSERDPCGSVYLLTVRSGFQGSMYMRTHTTAICRLRTLVRTYEVFGYLAFALLIDCCTSMILLLYAGHYDCQVNDKVNGRASYEYNKDRLFPAAIAASTSTDTKFGRLLGSVAVDPQVSALVRYLVLRTGTLVIVS